MNILTFDIEDWWVYEHYKLGNPSEYLPRLDRYLNEILDLLDERSFQATFFCLGKVAAKYPEVIKRIHSRGHHIGCHSFSHQFFGDATPEEVQKDTVKALAVLEDIIGEKVNAYRAPAFSITENNKWIFEILVANGIEYDSSIFPAVRRFGGFPSFKESQPLIINYKGLSIKEYPVPQIEIMGKRIAYSGGGYFRLMPYSFIKKIIANSDYTMSYFHIKDFDYQQERKLSLYSEKESLSSRYFKSYYGLNGAYSKFQKLLCNFEYVNIVQASKAIRWNEVPVVKYSSEVSDDE